MKIRSIRKIGNSYNVKYEKTLIQKLFKLDYTIKKFNDTGNYYNYFFPDMHIYTNEKGRKLRKNNKITVILNHYRRRL